MENKKPNAEEAYRTLLIIWAALLMSQFMFLVVLFAAKPELFKLDLSKPALGENATFIIVLALIAAANFAASFILKKRFNDQAVNEQNVSMLQTAMIVGCALCEAISLLGLMSAFIANYQYFFIFSAVGIIGMILHIPKRSDVHAASFRP